MKKSTFILIMFCLILNSSLFGQKKNAIKINLFSPIFRTGTFYYERKLTDLMSLDLGFSVTGFKNNDTKWSGFGVEPDLRFYPSKNEDLRGFYVAPFARYFSWNGENSSQATKGTLSFYGGGVMVGGQFIFGRVIVLDMFIGPQYLVFNSKTTEGNPDNLNEPKLKGFLVRGGITVGVAF